MRIAIITSQFNETITAKLQEGALSTLINKGLNESDISKYLVPGAVEIPLVAKLLAERKKYDAIIALGAVIRGETSHYDYVCEQVSQGCQRIMLDHNIPIIFGVLTTENEEQALDRLGGAHGHKGVDAANAAIEMAQLVKSISLDHSIA